MRKTVLASIVVALLGIVVWPLTPESTAGGRRTTVVIFYADETVASILESPNYRVLLSALNISENPLAHEFEADIISDARDFSDAVQRNVAALIAKMRKRNIDLAVFTNSLTLRHHWLLYRAATDQIQEQNFFAPSVSESAALALSPLSRPEFLRKALDEVGGLYPRGSLDVILISDSHGNAQMALMPRVAGDFSQTAVSEIRNAVDAGINGASIRAAWPTQQGTDKLTYWQVLAGAAETFEMRFSLVFRQACQSGITSWDEVTAVPRQIVQVADTGDRTLNYGTIDYTALAGTGVDTARDLAEMLENQEVTVRSRGWLWLEPARVMLLHSYPILFFMPLTVWLTWFGSRAMRRGLRQSR